MFHTFSQCSSAFPLCLGRAFTVSSVNALSLCFQSRALGAPSQSPSPEAPPDATAGLLTLSSDGLELKSKSHRGADPTIKATGVGSQGLRLSLGGSSLGRRAPTLEGLFGFITARRAGTLLGVLLELAPCSTSLNSLDSSMFGIEGNLLQSHRVTQPLEPRQDSRRPCPAEGPPGNR